MLSLVKWQHVLVVLVKYNNMEKKDFIKQIILSAEKNVEILNILKETTNSIFGHSMANSGPMN